MSNFDTRKDEIVNQHIADVLERKTASLVNNQDMPDNQSNIHRGYISALRDFAQFYNSELQKKLSEG